MTTIPNFADIDLVSDPADTDAAALPGDILL